MWRKLKNTDSPSRNTHFIFYEITFFLIWGIDIKTVLACEWGI